MVSLVSKVEDLQVGVGLDGVDGEEEEEEEGDGVGYERDAGAKQGRQTVPVSVAVAHVFEPQILKYETE